MSRSRVNNKDRAPLNNEVSSKPLSFSLEKNVSTLKETFDSCDDIVFRYAQFDNQSGCLVYLAEMISQPVLFEIEQGLSSYPVNQTLDKGDLASFIYQRFPLGVEQSADLQSVVEKIVSGHPILIVDEIDHVFSFSSYNQTDRNVTQSDAERTVRGPKEGFVEDIHTNLRLIRRDMKGIIRLNGVNKNGWIRKDRAKNRRRY